MNDYVNRNRQGFDIEQDLLAEAAITANATGDGILVGENVDITLVVKHNGTLGNADNTLASAIEESDDDITYTALGDMTTLTNAIVSDRQIMRTTKKYVRGDFTVAGTTISLGGAHLYLES
jgi:hypothetical protein